MSPPIFLRCAVAILIALLAICSEVRGAAATKLIVNVSFPGAVSYKEENLRSVIVEQLNEIAISGLTVARADDAAFFLKAYYRKQGFASAEVTYEIRGGRLILSVREGPRTFIQSLTFEGNRTFTSKVLEEYMIGVASGRLAESKLAYNESEVAEGAKRVAAYYQSEGFLDVKVETAGTRLTSNGRAAEVVVRISEGPKFLLGRISFTGHPVLPRQELIQVLALKDNAPFTPYAVDEMQRALRSHYRSKGFFNAKVDVLADRPHSRGGAVPVTFVCEPGPQFRVGRVVPRGTDRLSPEFLEKRFEPLQGKIYDPATLEARYRQLIQTGLFKTLHVRPVQDGPDTLKLDVEVVEAKAKEIGFQLGYGSYDGASAGFNVGDRNFLRHGRPLTLSLEYSQRGFRGELLYVDPWLFDSDWMLRARLFAQVRDEIGYSKSTQGVRLELTRKFTPHFEAGGYVVGETTRISSLDIDPRLVGPTDYLLAAVGLSQTLDFRNDVSNPTRGWVFTTTADLDTLDGQLAFARVTARYSWYRAFGKTLLGLGARAGWIIPIGDEVVPIDLRFFNGGSATVRSFAERRLGPKDLVDHPLGGQFYTVLNAEWDFPIKGALGGAVFTDAGNLLSNSEVSLDDMRFAIGVGLRYQLPFGPVRLDYGYNPTRKSGESTGAVHLSFGFAF